MSRKKKIEYNAGQDNKNHIIRVSESQMSHLGQSYYWSLKETDEGTKYLFINNMNKEHDVHEFDSFEAMEEFIKEDLS